MEAPGKGLRSGNRLAALGQSGACRGWSCRTSRISRRRSLRSFHSDTGQFCWGRAPLAYLIRPSHHCDPARRLLDGACQNFRRRAATSPVSPYLSGPSMGFLTRLGLCALLPVVAGPSLAVLGQILQDELSSNYGITFPWYAAVIIGIPRLGLGRVHRVHRSRSNGLWRVGLAEFLIVLALGLTGLMDPGPGGFGFYHLHHVLQSRRPGDDLRLLHRGGSDGQGLDWMGSCGTAGEETEIPGATCRAQSWPRS